MMRNLLTSVSHAGLLLVASWSASFVLESAATAQCEPAIAGSASTPGLARNVAVSGTTAYVVYETGLDVIDISDPVNPTTLGSLNTPGWASSVVVSGTTALVAAGNAGLLVIDVSNPTRPMILGSVNTLGDATGITVLDTTAYVTASSLDDFSGLHVIDVSDPENPTILGSIATDNPVVAYPQNVSVSGDRAYVTGYSFSPSGVGWLHVIDISNSSNPTILGSLNSFASAYDVEVTDNFAYVAAHFNNDSGLRVIDVSDPANPILVGSLNTPHHAWGIAVSGATAYVADGNSGLQAIDVSDPANPTLLGSMDLDGFAWDVSFSGSNAYVAADDFGLEVLDVQTCIVPGACCVNGVAVQLTASECAAVGGVFHGSGVPSEDVECTAGPCPGDMVTSKTFQPPPDGVVDGADLAYLLGAWGSCE